MSKPSTKHHLFNLQPTRVWLFFGVTAGLILLPLLINSSFLSGDDVGMHIFNAQSYANEMKQGNWFPQWLGGWYGGYGAPIGLVYPPLMYMAAGVMTSLGLTTLGTLKIILWVGLAISGVYMYKLTQYVNPGKGSYIAGMLFQVAPYRIFDLYSRGALPEFLAFTWMPIILLLALQSAKERNLIHYLLFSVALAGIFLTHLMVAYLFLFALFPFLVYEIFNTQGRRVGITIQIGFACLLSIMLVASYLSH